MYISTKSSVIGELTPLLCFSDPNIEAMYRHHTSLARLRRGRIDAGLFAVFCVVMLEAPSRMIRHGHEAQVPSLLTAAVFYFLCAMFYWCRPVATSATRNRRCANPFSNMLYALGNLLRVSDPQQWTSLQIKYRIVLQAIGCFIAASFFVHHCRLPGLSDVCSFIWPGGVAIEALVAYLLWLAVYPMLAAIPLSTALPLEIIITFALLLDNNQQCDFAPISCPNIAKQYRTCNTIAARIAYGLPISIAKRSEIDDRLMCLTFISFIKVCITGIFSYYVIVMSELRSRKAYAMEFGRYGAAVEATQGELWRVFLEMVLAAIVAWHAVSLVVGIMY